MISIKGKITNRGVTPLQMSQFRKVLIAYSTARVTIGLHEDAGTYPGTDPPSVVEVGLWNEFGTRFSPERSWLRSAIDENESQINAWREAAIRAIVDEFALHGVVTKAFFHKQLSSIGFKIQVLVQNKIKSNIPPPNTEETAMAKDKAGVAAVTLIDSGLMLRSVTYKVELS